MKKVHLSLIFILLFLIPSVAFGFIDYTRLIGYNAAALGRGGTDVAIATLPSSLNINPAGLVQLEGFQFESTLGLIHPTEVRFDYNGWEGERYRAKDKDEVLFDPALSLGYHPQGEKWAVGLSIAAPDALATDYTFHSKYFGTVNSYSEYLHLRGGLGVAYQLTPQLSVGARLDYNWQTFDLRLPLGIAYLDLGQCDAFGFSAGLGILYKLDNLSFGFAWSSRTAMSDLKSDPEAGYVKMYDPATGNINTISRLDVKLKDFASPHVFAWGIAYRPIKPLRISADLKYILWSDTWKTMKVRYSGPGADALPATAIDVPMNVKDQTPVGVGMEFFATENLTLSSGYHYGDNATPENNLFPQAPSTIEHSWTLGIRYQLRQLDIALAYIHSEGEDLQASSQHAVDVAVEPQLGLPIGALDSELNESRLEVGADVFFLTVSLPF